MIKYYCNTNNITLNFLKLKCLPLLKMLLNICKENLEEMINIEHKEKV
mgnify:CR=1 FL=1